MVNLELGNSLVQLHHRRGMVSYAANGWTWAIDSIQEKQQYSGDDLCVDCIRATDTITLEIAHFDTTTPECTLKNIIITHVMVLDKYGHFCSSPISSENVAIPTFRQGIRNFPQRPASHPPFDLNYRRLAVLEIPITCSNLTLDSEIGQVFVQFQYQDCNNDTITTTTILEYELGCPDTTGFLLGYNQHHTQPQSNTQLLPNYALAAYAIEMAGNVTVAERTRALLRICPGGGYIKVAKDTTTTDGGVLVARGAFFKAEKVYRE
ncbi:MAG: hypothetical protein HC892_12340 [Saprospiraceae bacterium]|nr:hypothetical protein [Saprospiraceae bacterium]